MRPAAPLALALLAAPARAAAPGCRVETAPVAIHAAGEGSADFARSSDCPPRVLGAFNEFLRSARGPMRAADAARVLGERTGADVAVAPDRIEVLDLAAFLSRGLGLPEGTTLEGASLVGGGPLLLGEGEGAVPSLAGGRVPGRLRVRLDVSGPGGGRTVWAKARARARARALVARRALPFGGGPLSPADFEEREVDAERPGDLFTDPSLLPFHRAARRIAKGAPLARADTAPLRLVSPARPVDVTFRSKNLSLRTRARPLGPGRYGDTVRLRRGGRTITGRVTGPGRVVVGP